MSFVETEETMGIISDDDLCKNYCNERVCVRYRTDSLSLIANRSLYLLKCSIGFVKSYDNLNKFVEVNRYLKHIYVLFRVTTCFLARNHQVATCRLQLSDDCFATRKTHEIRSLLKCHYDQIFTSWFFRCIT